MGIRVFNLPNITISYEDYQDAYKAALQVLNKYKFHYESPRNAIIGITAENIIRKHIFKLPYFELNNSGDGGIDINLNICAPKTLKNSPNATLDIKCKQIQFPELNDKFSWAIPSKKNYATRTLLTFLNVSKQKTNLFILGSIQKNVLMKYKLVNVKNSKNTIRDVNIKDFNICKIQDVKKYIIGSVLNDINKINLLELIIQEIDSKT